MADKDKVLFDKTEVSVYTVISGHQTILNLPYDKITSIQFDHDTLRTMLVLKKATDRIVINVRGMEDPVVLYSVKEGEKFSKYVDGLRKFAKDNRITVHDYLAHPEQR